VQQEYDVVFDSKQSYYSLFEEAGISWKKTETSQKTQNWSKKRQEITDWLEAHRAQIVSGQLVVFFVDECHLLWGDLCGYVWGKTDERIEVPIINERSKQTYYGAVNLSTQQCLIQAYKTEILSPPLPSVSLKPMSRESNCTAVGWSQLSSFR